MTCRNICNRVYCGIICNYQVKIELFQDSTIRKSLDNYIKRRIKEILRVNDLIPLSGGFLFLVYESFLNLDYKEASIEVIKAVKSHNQQ